MVIMQSVTVKLTEVYDLSTTQDKLGLIAIKTPSAAYISGKYSGLWKNFKYVRLNKCDVSVACASHLPADPLQIGQDPGKVAPQDMFNPILYGAVSNESWDYLVSRIYQTGLPFTTRAGGVRFASDAFGSLGSGNNWNIYYSLLADEKFKKAMVQTGLSMRGLRPLVYAVLSTAGYTSGLNGDVQPTMDSMNDIVTSSGAGAPATITGASPNNGNTIFKGHPKPMPRVPTLPYGSSLIGGIPSSYVGVIIVPPASLNLTYFRLVCSWYVTFEVLRSDGQIDVTAAQSYGVDSHYESYSLPIDPSEKLSDTFVSDAGDGVGRSVVGDGIDLNLVMES